MRCLSEFTSGLVPDVMAERSVGLVRPGKGADGGVRWWRISHPVGMEHEDDGYHVM